MSLKTAESYRSGLQFKPVFAKDFFLKSASNLGEPPFILPSFRFLFGHPSLPAFLSASPKTDCRWKKLIGLTRPPSQDDTTARATTAALTRTATRGGRAGRRRSESPFPELAHRPASSPPHFRPSQPCFRGVASSAPPQLSPSSAPGGGSRGGGEEFVVC